MYLDRPPTAPRMTLSRARRCLVWSVALSLALWLAVAAVAFSAVLHHGGVRVTAGEPGVAASAVRTGG